MFGVSVWRYPPRLSFMDLEVQDSQMSLNGNFEQRERATKPLVSYCFIIFILFFNTWLSGSGEKAFSEPFSPSSSHIFHSFLPMPPALLLLPTAQPSHGDAVIVVWPIIFLTQRGEIGTPKGRNRPPAQSRAVRTSLFCWTLNESARCC